MATAMPPPMPSPPLAPAPPAPPWARLPRKEVLVMVAVELFSRARPPPMPSPPASPLAPAPPIAVLPLSVLLLSARLPPLLKMPPPMPAPPAPPLAWLLMILLEATFSVPWLAMPPPATAELPLTVQLVSVVECRIVGQAAAVAGGGVAADGAVGQRGRTAVELSRPPPLAPAELPLTVQLVSVVAPCCTRRRRCRSSSAGVAADGAVGQRGRTCVAVAQAAAVVGGVAADGAVSQRGRATE